MNNEQITAFYDGHCGLCHMAVSFLLKRDRSGKICFAPIQSDFYRAFATTYRISLTPRSILVYDESEHRMLAESAAVFHLLLHCGKFWRTVVGLCRIVPLPFWNMLYRLLARVRHHIFARQRDLVPMLPANLRERVRHP